MEHSTCSFNLMTDFYIKGVCVSQKQCGGLMVKAITHNVRDPESESDQFTFFWLVIYTYPLVLYMLYPRCNKFLFKHPIP